jgi:hypothetical protein
LFLEEAELARGLTSDLLAVNPDGKVLLKHLARV